MPRHIWPEGQVPKSDKPGDPMIGGRKLTSQEMAAGAKALAGKNYKAAGAILNKAGDPVGKDWVQSHPAFPSPTSRRQKSKQPGK